MFMFVLEMQIQIVLVKFPLNKNLNFICEAFAVL